MAPRAKKKKTGEIRYVRSLAAAKTDRLLADFNAPATSADAEIRFSLPILRQRSRQLYRDNDYFKGAIRVIQNNVVGQGIKFQFQVPMQRGANKLDLKKNKELKALWDSWCCAENCDVAGKKCFTEIERVAIATVAKNGEALIRIHRQQFGKSRVPMALEMLSSDMLDDRYNVSLLENGGDIRMGIERDKWKRPIAYWFLSRDPGDYTQSGWSEYGRRVRVPAADVIHLFVEDDETQTRGVPWFHTAINRLHHMQGYEESELVAARTTASLMGFIETPEGEVHGDDVVDGERVTEFEPGTFKNLPPGAKVNVPNIARPGGQFDPFMRFMIRGVAAGVGASYSSISRDYSDSNYSASRQGLLEDRDNWRALQWWMIGKMHERILSEFVDMVYLSGVVDMPLYPMKPEAYQCVKFMPRGWGWIDPNKEVEANKQAVRCGFKTLAEVIAEQGGDFEEVMQARAEEMKLIKSLGLVLDTDPDQVDAQGKPAQASAPAPGASDPNAQNNT